VRRRALIAALGCACGDGGPAGDGRVGPLIELPLLAAIDPASPFNHSREVTLAARGGRVVVAAIHEHFASADSFDTTGFHKRVAINVSADRGASFGAAVDPRIGDQTSDPVVRLGPDGTFWVTALDTANTASCHLARSSDGETWTPVASNIPIGDKEWMVVDAQAVWIAAAGGHWKYGFDGTQLGMRSPGLQMAAAYIAADGLARFGTLGYQVQVWDGNAVFAEGAMLPAGPDASLQTSASWSLGDTGDGRQWSVRATRTGATGAIVARIRRAPAEEGADIAITTPGAVAFLPAAARDDRGRLHVVWYDSAGERGVLAYAHSVSSNLAEGFTEPLVIDPDATPGNGWYPTTTSEDGGRRLREYIDVAIDGDRLHVAYTHAPAPPSRVHATYVRID
jgi:hypothetical protein